MMDLFGNDAGVTPEVRKSSYKARMRRARIKKRRRDLRMMYLSLSGEINCPLCIFCKYSTWEGTDCSDGYQDCIHPLNEISEWRFQEVLMEPYVDCWGFRIGMKKDLAVDITGVILQYFKGKEWMYRIYKGESATIYGWDKIVRINPVSRDLITNISLTKGGADDTSS